MTYRPLRFILFGSVALLIAVITLPRLAGAVAINLGQVGLVSLLSRNQTPTLVRTLQRETIGPLGEAVGEWLSGHIAVAEGQYPRALKSLSPLEPYAAQYPLLLQDLLIAYSRTGHARESIALYERAATRVRLFPEVADAVALSYLDQHTLDPASADYLRSVLQVRPDDLYANYHLRLLAEKEGNRALAGACLDNLVRFSLEAINPVDERLVAYTIQVMPALIEEGIWDWATMASVASVLVQHYPAAPGLDELLLELANKKPFEPVWSFYRAEAYRRRGDLAKAVQAYGDTLKQAPSHPGALLQLGLVAEAQGRDHDAIAWYERYVSVSPDDTEGLLRLIAVGERLGSPDTAEFSAKLTELLDDRAWVASQLDRKAEEVWLGPNLVANSNLEQWQGNTPEAWAFSSYLGATGREGLYASGPDTATRGKKNLVITALRGGALDDGTTTYAEYGGQPFGVKSARYLLSVTYRANYIDGTGLFLLGQYLRPDGTVVANFGLPSTANQWKRVRVVTDAPAFPASVSPLVRNWGMGELQIANVEVREIVVQGAP